MKVIDLLNMIANGKIDYTTKFDAKVNVGYCDLDEYFERYPMNENYLNCEIELEDTPKEDKEIERLNKELDISIEVWNNKQKEIVRLNNIIDELEKYIVNEINIANEELNVIMNGNDLAYKNECSKEFNCIKKFVDRTLDKLQELKEGK